VVAHGDDGNPGGEMATRDSELGRVKSHRASLQKPTLLIILTGILLSGCGVQTSAQNVALQTATATCDPATTSGRVLGDRTDPAIDFQGSVATVSGSDGTVYRGDLHPLFSGSGDSAEVSFSGDVTSPSGRQQHVTGSVHCQTPAAAGLPVGGSADFTFGGMRNSTCPAGSIPLGFAAGYKVAESAGGHDRLSARGVAGSVPSLVVTAAGRRLHIEGRAGSLRYSTSVGGQTCAADYKALLAIKP